MGHSERGLRYNSLTLPRPGSISNMRAVVQRVRSCRVIVAGEPVGEIGRGLLVLLGVRTGDSAEQVRWLADKVVNLRIFEDDQGKMNVGVADAGGSILVV